MANPDRRCRDAGGSLWLRLPLALATLAVLALPLRAQAGAYDGPLFDGHIHYNADVWDAIEPADAIARLRAVGIRHALVSSTPTAGTERLHTTDQALVVPLLRPYRSTADRRSWYADSGLVARLRERLDAFPYRGIGEFHVFGADAATPVVDDMIALASERRLFLQAHADEQAIVHLVERAPDVTVIWAHAGFDVPVARLGEMLARYPNLLIELSYRSDIAPLGTLADDWRELFLAWPRRFMVGMDTHVGGRWAELPELAGEARGWLAQLPPEVAARIAFDNAMALIDDRRR